MADVQKSNGYTTVAHEMLEAMARFKIAPEMQSVLFIVIRKTWGWDKREDRIALRTFEAMTGIGRANICRAIRQLKEANMLVRDAKGMTRIQKDYDLWKLPPRIQPVAKMPRVKNDNLPVAKMTPPPVAKMTPSIEQLIEPIKRTIGERRKRREAKPPTVLKKSKPIEPPEPMNQDIDRSIPRKRLYGDEPSNFMLDLYEHLLGRDTVDPEKWSKIYIRHLKTKIGMGKLREVLEWMSDPDCWWYGRITGFKMLYYKRDTILKSMAQDREDKKKSVKPYIDGDRAYQDERGDWKIIPRNGGEHLTYVGPLDAICYE